MTKTADRAGDIRVGIGGWTFEPWRDVFYPKGLAHAKELRHASRQMTSIEVNGTYYRTQTPKTFKNWHDETPDDFIFSLKASRYATNRKNLGEAEAAVTRFVQSGITELGPKLGPILWQLAPTKAFEPDEIDRFIECLPKRQDGIALRHVLEVRHDSFKCEAFVVLARAHGIAICLALSDDYPLIADPTADFVYLRLQTSTEDQPQGYQPAMIETFATYAKTFARGDMPAGLPMLGDRPVATKRDCFIYMISGAKVRNPAAAQALLAALT